MIVPGHCVTAFGSGNFFDTSEVADVSLPRPVRFDYPGRADEWVFEFKDEA